MKKQKKTNNKIPGLISVLIILILIISNQLFGGNLYNFALDFGNNTTSTYTSFNNIDENLKIEDGKLNVLFLYVGQADCTLIKNDNYSMLIDSGNLEDGANIVNFLKQIGINKLDYLVGTHSDEDHIGGATYILQNLQVDKLYISSIGHGKSFYDSTINKARERNVEVGYPELDEKIPFGSIDIKVKSAEKYEGISSNNSSIVLQLTYINNKFLFMGDCEKESESVHSWEKVDVLKVGHHGSNTSSTEDFLNQVRPHYAVIQVGKNNQYRLPNKYVIKRLEMIDANVLRTDINETSFLFVSDGTNIIEKEINLNLDSNE